MALIDEMLKQYEKSVKAKESKQKEKLSDEERLKKYFSIYINPKDGVSSKQVTVRILPTTDGTSPFKEVFYHNIQVDGKYQKIYDPEMNDNEPSPISDVYKELMNTGDENDRKLASKYRASKYYIVKIIERGKEEDGPKFWRFKDSYKKDGIFDKIYPIIASKGDITDPVNGRDITLHLVTQSLNNAKGTYTAVSSIMHEDPTPLSDNDEQVKEWIENEETWEDVYSKKPIEYLQAVAAGETPVWDKNLKKFTFGDGSTEDANFGDYKSDELTNDVTDSDTEDEDDDVPF